MCILVYLRTAVSNYCHYFFHNSGLRKFRHEARQSWQLAVSLDRQHWTLSVTKWRQSTVGLLLRLHYFDLSVVYNIIESLQQIHGKAK